MKRIILIFLAVLISLPFFAQRGVINIPDLEGYVTLKCDFHIHTVFSDGMVWPTIRIDEAYREGLDAIAITDHIEYRPHRADIPSSHNRSYEIAKPRAEERGIILIRGGEITRSMPPGHSNAIFLNDADKLEQQNYTDAYLAAKEQNAFIFWNHPGWLRQQPDTTMWWHEHTLLLQQGMLHGIEVAGNSANVYYPEAHYWALEKKLTMLGNSDIHDPIQAVVDFAAGKRRTMTLVFAKERTEEAIREALFERRTAVYWKEYIIGEEKYLKELFEKAVDIRVRKTDSNTVEIRFRNSSDLTFHLTKDDHDPRLTYLRNINVEPFIIEPNQTRTITVRLNNGIESGNANFIIQNFLSEPGKGMRYTVRID